MMNDGDNEETVEKPVEAVPVPVSAPAPEEATAAAAAAAPVSADELPPVPLKQQFAHAAEVAASATMKATHGVATKVKPYYEKTREVTSEVATKVTHASKEAYEASVRRISKKGGDAAAAPEGEEVEGEEAKPAADAVGAEDSAEKPAEKVSMWDKVRKASGTAALKAAGAAQAAYKAAEPVGQKVADGAKSAYEKAKPVAEMAAHRTQEGATAAWHATKDGTAKAVDRVRSMSGVSAHGEAHITEEDDEVTPPPAASSESSTDK
jgi:hypothetical protein